MSDRNRLVSSSTIITIFALYFAFLVIVSSMLLFLVPKPIVSTYLGDKRQVPFIGGYVERAPSGYDALHVVPEAPKPRSVLRVEGRIIDHASRSPISYAEVGIFKVQDSTSAIQRVELRSVADSGGHFYLEVPVVQDPRMKSQRFLVYAYYDNQSSEGIDYVPSFREVIWTSNESFNLVFGLWEGASLLVDSWPVFVEAIQNPSVYVRIEDANTGDELKLDVYSSPYCAKTSRFQIPGVDERYVVLPAEKRLRIRIDCQFGPRQPTYSLLLDKPEYCYLEKGEAVHVDLRSLSLPISSKQVRESVSEVRGLLTKREEEGFYTSIERQRFAQISLSLAQAEMYLSQGAYDICYLTLRFAYVEIQNLRNWLSSMYAEAITSVYSLLAFLAFSAIATAFLAFEHYAKKLAGSFAFYTVFVAALYVLYPGSRLVSLGSFVATAMLSVVAVFGVMHIAAKMMKSRRTRTRVSIWNLMVPILSIAKRNLRTRRLRFELTLLSVTILVSSFISLTSFATGFGLIFQRVLDRPTVPSAVLIRGPQGILPPELEARANMSAQHLGNTVSIVGDSAFNVAWFPPLDNSSLSVLEQKTEVVLAAPKMENLPFEIAIDGLIARALSTPVSVFGIRCIEGIVGVLPTAEAAILKLDEIIIKGRYLEDGDEEAALISQELSHGLNLVVNDVFKIDTLTQDIRLRVVGIFDDDRLAKLRDVDGQLFLPWMIKIEVTVVDPETGTMIITKTLVPCSPRGTVIVTLRKAAQINDVYISRLDAMLKPVPSLTEYAKNMALDRGFRVWASTDEGVYLAQITSYFEGKGVPLGVPWIIVVVNVVVTMLNSFYERKRDIFIYSAIGLNPSHVSALFLAEAVIIGLLGGGFGYLLGLGWYQIMSALTIALQVKQKVSVFWVLGAIAVSMSSTLVGGVVAVKGSLVITPSLKRRWGGEERTIGLDELTGYDLPIEITEEDADSFLEHIITELKARLNPIEFSPTNIRQTREETMEECSRILEFTYRTLTPFAGLYARNKVILTRKKTSQDYKVSLWSKGDTRATRRSADLLRSIFMEWSVYRGKERMHERI